jgi:hypothetical protein
MRAWSASLFLLALGLLGCQASDEPEPTEQAADPREQAQAFAEEAVEAIAVESWNPDAAEEMALPEEAADIKGAVELYASLYQALPAEDATTQLDTYEEGVLGEFATSKTVASSDEHPYELLLELSRSPGEEWRIAAIDLFPETGETLPNAQTDFDRSEAPLVAFEQYVAGPIEQGDFQSLLEFASDSFRSNLASSNYAEIIGGGMEPTGMRGFVEKGERQFTVDEVMVKGGEQWRVSATLQPQGEAWELSALAITPASSRYESVPPSR